MPRSDPTKPSRSSSPACNEDRGLSHSWVWLPRVQDFNGAVRRRIEPLPQLKTNQPQMETSMTLAQSLRKYIEACFTAIWIQTFEHADALTELTQLCQQQDPPWRLASWDIETGL